MTTNHAGHHPDRFTRPDDPRRYWEVPSRIDALTAAVRVAGHDTKLAADHGLAPVARVHDADYLNFLQTAFERWRVRPDAGPILRATSFPIRHGGRRPRDIAGQSGFYLSSLSAPIVEATWAAALQSAHASIDAADAILAGERLAYALCRPPGHHAHSDLAGGFCYLNNAAIAAQRILDRGLVHVAILDFDVHHGNGTQQIFYARDDVHYVSVHGDPAEMYPWFAGYADETGQGSGLGWNLNLPLPPNTGDAAFVAAVEQGLDAIARQHPAVLVVSVGFDAQAGDPTGNLAVGTEGFAAIGRRVAALDLPTVLIQEGGYLIERLGANLTAFLSGLREPSA